MRRSRERSLRSARSELCDAVGSSHLATYRDFRWHDFGAGLCDRQGENYATQSGAVFAIDQKQILTWVGAGWWLVL
jgi:hypothetical protein